MKNSKKIIIVSGYFNPLHKGHIEYFELSKSNGDLLLVIINNDYQRKLKGSKFFMDEIERELIVSKLKVVDFTLLSIDKGRSVVETLKLINTKYAKNYDLVFANGGDQTIQTSPEKEICDLLGIGFIDGMGDKIQSSSWLLTDYNDQNRK